MLRYQLHRSICVMIIFYGHTCLKTDQQERYRLRKQELVLRSSTTPRFSQGLDGIAQILHLTQQPRSCHRDAHRTDQESNHAQDQSIGKITREQHQQSQNSNYGVYIPVTKLSLYILTGCFRKKDPMDIPTILKSLSSTALMLTV